MKTFIEEIASNMTLYRLFSLLVLFSALYLNSSFHTLDHRRFSATSRLMSVPEGSANSLTTQGKASVISFSSLIRILEDKSGFHREDIGKVMNCFVDAIREEVLEKGNDVRIPSLGTFRAYCQPERTGFNPRTREKIPIKARKVVVFRRSKSLSTANSEEK